MFRGSILQRGLLFRTEMRFEQVIPTKRGERPSRLSGSAPFLGFVNDQFDCRG